MRFLFSFVLLLFACQSLRGEQVKEVEKLLESVIAARSGVNAIELKIRFMEFYVDSGLETEYALKVGKDGKKRYIEIACVRDDSHRLPTVSFVQTEHESIEYTDVVQESSEPDFVPIQGVVTSNKLDPTAKNSFFRDRINPFAIGMLPTEVGSSGVFDYKKMYSMDFLSPKTASVEDAVYEGASCKKITIISHKNKGLIESKMIYFVSASQDHAVRKMDCAAFQDGQQRNREVLESQGAIVPGSSVWFPTRVRFEKYKKDKKIFTETAEIEVVSLNRPISPERCTIKGMTIPNGTLFRFNPRDPRVSVKKLQDGKLEDFEIVMPKNDADTPSEDRRADWYWYGVGVGGLFLSLLGYRIYQDRFGKTA